MKFPEIEVALNEMAALERKLKDPGGPIEQIIALYAVRVAIASLETVGALNAQSELSVSVGQ
jgi:hypothetical protein